MLSSIDLPLESESNISDRDDDILEYAAVEQSDGSYIDSYQAKMWYNEDGAYHKVDGPAITYRLGYIQWYLHGDQYHSFNQWLEESPIPDIDKMMLRLQYG